MKWETGKVYMNLADRGTDCSATRNCICKMPPGTYRTLSPATLDVPDVVVPLFERDVCKAKYLAKSLAVHDPEKRLGDVILMWVSTKSADEYSDEIGEMNRSLAGNHRVRFIDFSPHVNRQGMAGWFAQQILKLKISSVVSSNYYVVLDAKNAILKDVKADTFFSRCNQGKMLGTYKADEIPKPHVDWYRASALALDVRPPEVGLWPSSVTPVVIHKKTVERMLKSVGEGNSVNKFCDGPLCDMLGAKSNTGVGATEFTLYTLFARNRVDFERIHSINDVRSSSLNHRWGASLWRGTPKSEKFIAQINSLKCLQIASGKEVPLMFGSQPGILERMNPSQRDHTTKLLVQIYQTARLHNPKETSTEELLNCAIGSWGGAAGAAAVM
jgi:hypothetical protein